MSSAQLKEVVRDADDVDGEDLPPDFGELALSFALRLFELYGKSEIGAAHRPSDGLTHVLLVVCNLGRQPHVARHEPPHL